MQSELQLTGNNCGPTHCIFSHLPGRGEVPQLRVAFVLSRGILNLSAPTPPTRQCQIFPVLVVILHTCVDAWGRQFSSLPRRAASHALSSTCLQVIQLPHDCTGRFPGQRKEFPAVAGHILHLSRKYIIIYTVCDAHILAWHSSTVLNR